MYTNLVDVELAKLVFLTHYLCPSKISVTQNKLHMMPDLRNCELSCRTRVSLARVWEEEGVRMPRIYEALRIVIEELRWGDFVLFS